MALITYEWFKTVQHVHYPGVAFPGTQYHPRRAGGYSMAMFLDANLHSHRIFLAKGWYPKHFSHCRLQQGGRLKLKYRAAKDANMHNHRILPTVARGQCLSKATEG